MCHKRKGSKIMNIDIYNTKVVAIPSKEIAIFECTQTLPTCYQHILFSKALPSSNLLFSSLFTEQIISTNARIKPQPNRSLVQGGFDLLFDERCLIMGFRTKLVSIVALRSTFLCRSADPSLHVLKDGLYDLSCLVTMHVISRGGKVKTRTTSGNCHQTRACDLYHNARAERQKERERE